MAILARVTLRDILDRDPHHPVTKAIEVWINNKLQRSIEDVIDAWISVEEKQETYGGRRIGQVYVEIDISVTFKDRFEAHEILYVR